MIYTDETLQLEEKLEELLNLLNQSKTSLDYQKAQKRLQESQEVVEKKAQFLKAKEAYEKIETYGLHTPGYKETYRELRKAKRALDLVPEVEDFKVAQTTLQDQLDQIAYRLSKFVSEEVKVDYGNPFFHRENTHHSCQGGGCQSHGK